MTFAGFADGTACWQYFTVDDLNVLKRTGRVSGAAALIGTALNIKPILYGDDTGHIVSCAGCRTGQAFMSKLMY